MRKTLLAVLAIVALTGCSVGSKAGATKTVTGAAATPATSTIAASTTADPTVLAELQAGDHPPCSQVVNVATNLVITGNSGQLNLHCITGPTASTDATKAGSILCDPGDPSSLVYYWSSQSQSSADQNVYAAKAGGVVVIVADETASEFATHGPALAAVFSAVGVRC
jgi:hypothetical protein